MAQFTDFSQQYWAKTLDVGRCLANIKTTGVQAYFVGDSTLPGSCTKAFQGNKIELLFIVPFLTKIAALTRKKD